MKFLVASLEPRSLEGAHLYKILYMHFTLPPQGYVPIKSRNGKIPGMPQLIPKFPHVDQNEAKTRAHRFSPKYKPNYRKTRNDAIQTNLLISHPAERLVSINLDYQGVKKGPGRNHEEVLCRFPPYNSILGIMSKSMQGSPVFADPMEKI